MDHGRKACDDGPGSSLQVPTGMRASPVSAPLTIAAVEPSRAEPEAPPRFARGVIAITFAPLRFVIARYALFALLTRALGPRDVELTARLPSSVSRVHNR